MLPVSSILVDFDGTACLHDVAEHLLIRYGDPSWPSYDEAWARGEIGAREGIRAQAAMLDTPTDELLSYALEHCPMDPTFAPFVTWARDRGLPLTLVSDGFGFYIAPLLSAARIEGVGVITNTWRDGEVDFENGHGECVGCGTCKMRAVLDAPGPVAFIGEGDSTTRRMLEEILAVEEEHADDLASLLAADTSLNRSGRG